MEITVIGAGALGMSAAWALAEEGHDVTLHEQGQPGEGSTAKAAGICSTMTAIDDDYDLIAATRGIVGETISLAAGELPSSRGAWRSHESILVAKGGGLQSLDDVQARLERHTEEPERLDARQAAAEFRGVRFEPGEEVLVAQEDGVIDAGEFVPALRWRLESEGVDIRAASHVSDRPDGPVVVAGGAWTRGLLGSWGIDLPVQHFRTQAASIGLPDSLDLPIVHDTVHGFYTRPESDASTVAGDGTRLTDHEPDAYNQAGGPVFHEHIARCVTQRFEHGDHATIRNSWAGLCVATPDTRPLCGPIDGQDDLFVLTGDNGFGLMRCLGLGERLAAAVNGDVAAATDPRRFTDVRPGWEMREGFAF